MNFAIQTLGCKVNQYESQALEQILTARGHTCVPFHAPADAYIINTCSVTAISDKKSRQSIRKARKMAPESILAVCGCYTQTHGDELDALSIDLISGTGDKQGFATLLETAVAQRQTYTITDDVFSRNEFEILPPGSMDGRTRAMLKIEDGCVNFCSYCIIPYARGKVRSLSLSDAVQQAKKLASDGYLELVLTGIEISSWGDDLPDKPPLIDLLEAICHAVPTMRVRLGSLEPRTITREFCQRASKLKNLCPHFHLSLQSGCDKTLARMKRKYDCNRYYLSINLLNEYFDLPAITTDLIVGFPQEDEEEFSQTLSFIEQCAFSSMHIFPYSRRPGTPAADMPGQISNEEKSSRAARAAQVADSMTQQYLKRHLHAPCTVLFEETQDGFWFGHTKHYMKVCVPSDENLHNRFCTVYPSKFEQGILYGTLLQEETT